MRWGSERLMREKLGVKTQFEGIMGDSKKEAGVEKLEKVNELKLLGSFVSMDGSMGAKLK